MKNFKILTLCALAFLGSCKVDKDVEPSFQNNIEQFSFIKMNLLGEKVEKNLSMYANGFIHNRYDYRDGWLQRTFQYVGNANKLVPEENYFDDVAAIGVDWETRSDKTLEERVGNKYAISPTEYRDNYVAIAINYNTLLLEYKYRDQDSVLFVGAKDTLIAGRPYELSHLYFEELEFEDEQGNVVMVEDLELRQVIYINEW